MTTTKEVITRIMISMGLIGTVIMGASVINAGVFSVQALLLGIFGALLCVGMDIRYRRDL